MHLKNAREKYQLSGIQKNELVIAEQYKLQGGKLILTTIYAKKEPALCYILLGNYSWQIGFVSGAPRFPRKILFLVIECCLINIA